MRPEDLERDLLVAQKAAAELRASLCESRENLKAYNEALLILFEQADDIEERLRRAELVMEAAEEQIPWDGESELHPLR